MSAVHQTFDLPAQPQFEVKYYYDTAQEKKEAGIYPPHLHDELEIYILLEGNVSFMVEQHLYSLDPGNAVVSKPNEIHNCILNEDGPHRHLCFWFQPNGFLLEKFLLQPFGTGNLIRSADPEALFRICAELQKKTEDKLERYAQFAQLLSILSAGLNACDVSSAHVAMPQILKDIVSDINRNFQKIPNLTYITEKYFISPSTLLRLFRNYLHTSPKLYLETKKLSNARILLKQGKSVIDSCYESGFSDYPSYIKLFKKRFGMTPLHYRNS